MATDRLRFVYQLNRGLTSVADVSGLVRVSTQRLRELFEAEGSALIMLDRQRNELYFPIVSQVDRLAQSRIERVRFPADQGIAGWVLKNDQPAIVSDAKSDPRHYQGVDERSKLHTRSILAAPLRTARGVIGVVEVINPADQFLTQQDLEFLDHMAGDIAVACERARLFDLMDAELSTIRRALRIGGAAAVGIGLTLVAGALSLAEPLHPRIAVAASVALLSLGLALYGAGFGLWPRRRKTTTRP